MKALNSVAEMPYYQVGMAEGPRQASRIWLHAIYRHPPLHVRRRYTDAGATAGLAASTLLLSGSARADADLPEGKTRLSVQNLNSFQRKAEREAFQVICGL